MPASVPFPCYEVWQFESNCADDVFRVGVGEKLSKIPVDDLIQLLRTEGGPYHQKKFRLKAKNAHANVVTACEERFATQKTAQTTALQDQLMSFTLQIEARQQVT